MNTDVLIAYLAKVSVVLALAWIASLVLWRASAAVRHQVWASAVLGVLVLPVFVWSVPVWRVVVSTRTVVVDLPKVVESSPGPMVGGPPAEMMVRSAGPRAGGVSGVELTLVVWGVGAMMLLARLAWGLGQLRRLRRKATLVEGLQDGVSLLESASADSMPMAWGWREPCVMLPARFRDWDRERLNVVLAHELAHVRRRDWLVQIAAEVVKCLYWFHPLAWVAAARVREESERAADDAVLRAGIEGPAYAKHLLDVARAHQAGLGEALAMAGYSPIERRLNAMLDRSVRRNGLSRGAVVGSLLASVAALVPFAAFLPAQETLRVVAQNIPAGAPAAAPKAPAAASTVQATAQATTPVPVVDQTKSGYVLAPGDEVLIRSNLEEINRAYRVDEDGSINFPLVGRVLVTGMTVDAVERDLVARFRQLFVRPEVSVTYAGKARSLPTVVATPLVFEVATIKPVPTGGGMIMAGANVSTGGRVILSAISLKALIAVAYRIPFQRITGGEAWTEKEQYIVEAKAPESANITNLRHSYWDIEDEGLREMLRSLLADRFQLRVRRETKSGDVYVLDRTDRTLKLKQRSTEEEDARGTAGWAGIWVLNSITMPQLAKFASDYMVHAPVTDRTGLHGTFDYRQASEKEEPAGADQTDSFLRMLDEVGLKLVKSKGEVESLVIDSVSKPTEN